MGWERERGGGGKAIMTRSAWHYSKCQKILHLNTNDSVYHFMRPSKRKLQIVNKEMQTYAEVPRAQAHICTSYVGDHIPLTELLSSASFPAITVHLQVENDLRGELRSLLKSIQSFCYGSSGCSRLR